MNNYRKASVAAVLAVMCAPALAGGSKMPQQPVADASAHASSDAVSQARAETTNTLSSGQSLVNAPNNATSAVGGAGGDSSNAMSFVNDVLSLGFARGVASDALQECHERSGVKDVIAGGWGGKVEINRECLTSKREIERIYAEAARMQAEAALIEARRRLVTEQSK